MLFFASTPTPTCNVDTNLDSFLDTTNAAPSQATPTVPREIPLELEEELFSRNRFFFEEGFDTIRGALVIVVGLGGVGSHAAHMLVSCFDPLLSSGWWAVVYLSLGISTTFREGEYKRVYLVDRCRRSERSYQFFSRSPVSCVFCAIDATNRNAHTHTNTQNCVAHAAGPRGSTVKHSKMLAISCSAVSHLLRSCGPAPSGEGDTI